MNVRLARPTDARAIACVHVASWQTTYPGIMPDDVLANLSVEARERYWAHVLGDPRGQHIVYVAEDDAGKIVGFASGGPERTGDSVYQGELYAIYLLATRQRKGLGRRLVRCVATRLAQLGFRAMLVRVLAASPARAFYERLGGHYVREQPITIGSTTMREIAYGWTNLAVLLSPAGYSPSHE